MAARWVLLAAGLGGCRWKLHGSARDDGSRCDILGALPKVEAPVEGQ